MSNTKIYSTTINSDNDFSTNFQDSFGIKSNVIEIADVENTKFLIRYNRLYDVSEQFRKENVKKKFKKYFNEDTGKFRVRFTTSNLQKIEELNSYLNNNDVGRFIENMFEFNFLTEKFDSEESATTFIGVAKEKNIAYAKAYWEVNHLVFSEDSGIDIFCLPESFNVRSKRFAFDNISYIVESHTKQDFSQEFINELVENVRNMKYDHTFNNRVLVMKVLDNLNEDKDIDSRIVFHTGASLGYCTSSDTKPFKQVSKGSGMLFGKLNINKILYNSEEVIHCKFGFNNLVMVNVDYTQLKSYGEMPLSETIKFNHRSLAYSEAFVSFLEEAFG